MANKPKTPTAPNFLASANFRRALRIAEQNINAAVEEMDGRAPPFDSMSECLGNYRDNAHHTALEQGVDPRIVDEEFCYLADKIEGLINSL